MAEASEAALQPLNRAAQEDRAWHPPGAAPGASAAGKARSALPAEAGPDQAVGARRRRA
jgi:hypothetical protein